MNNFAKGVSYIDSSRGLHPGRGCEDVYHRRPGDCLRNGGISCLWGYLLGNDLVLTAKRLAEWQAFNRIFDMLLLLRLHRQLRAKLNGLQEVLPL